MYFSFFLSVLCCLGLNLSKTTNDLFSRFARRNIFSNIRCFRAGVGAHAFDRQIAIRFQIFKKKIASTLPVGRLAQALSDLKLLAGAPAWIRFLLYTSPCGFAVWRPSVVHCVCPPCGLSECARRVQAHGVRSHWLLVGGRVKRAREDAARWCTLCAYLAFLILLPLRRVPRRCQIARTLEREVMFFFLNLFKYRLFAEQCSESEVQTLIEALV